MVTDLSKRCWPWESESVDGIYARHCLEHFFDWKAFIDECVRILKPGGYLHIIVPHSSDVNANGALAHYRAFSFLSIDGILSQPTEFYPNPPFKTVVNKLRWLNFGDTLRTHPERWKGRLEPKYVNQPMLNIAKALDKIITPLINLNPLLFERMWCYWVGGAAEVEWKGVKV